MKLIEEMEKTTRYVRGLETKSAALEATCDEFSRIIACFVRVHGGRIPSVVWDEVHAQDGFFSCGKHVYVGGVKILVKEPSDSY